MSPGCTSITPNKGLVWYASPAAGLAPHSPDVRWNMPIKDIMKAGPISVMKFTLLAMSSICLAEDALRLPNPRVLSHNFSGPINIMADTNGNGTMPESIFIDVSSGVVAAISFNYKAGVGFDKACAAADASFSNRQEKVANKVLSQYAVWADLDNGFSLIVQGETNQATVTLQSIAPGAMENMILSKGVTPGIADHHTNDTEQGASVVRDPRGGDHAPQP